MINQNFLQATTDADFQRLLSIAVNCILITKISIFFHTGRRRTRSTKIRFGLLVSQLTAYVSSESKNLFQEENRIHIESSQSRVIFKGFIYK